MTTTPPNSDSESRPEYRSERSAGDAAGLMERRYPRHQRRAAQARRNRLIVFGIVGVGLLMLVVGWRYTVHGGASVGLIPQRSSAQAMDMIRAAEPAPTPTPNFASLGKVMLRLPVAAADLTEVGFHQASFDYALPMKTPLPDADMKTAKREKGSRRDLSAQETGPDAVLVGSVLRMWRNRPGKPNTAADIGAAPGSKVLSPMDGTVVLVKRYKLYGKYADVQIHIRPDGAPGVDCVLIHIKDPQVKAGDRVIGGVSPLGAVRELSNRMNLQLGHYTPDGGDHVHLQLNDATHPDYEGLDGATIASGS